MVKSSDKLVGKHIIVVGGTSGIGFGAAKAFTEAGANVTVISSSQSKVDSAVSRLGSATANGLVGDVLNEAAFISLLENQGAVDHIVFSGVDRIILGNLEDLDLDATKDLFGVKFWGSVTVAKAVAKHSLIKKGGSLILTAGVSGLKPSIVGTVGAALNGGILSLTRSLAKELAQKGVRVNVVVPGLVITELWDKLDLGSENQKKLIENANLPVGFVAKADDISEAYLYLAKADYATGTQVIIDGGAMIT